MAFRVFKELKYSTAKSYAEIVYAIKRLEWAINLIVFVHILNSVKEELVRFFKLFGGFIPACESEPQSIHLDCKLLYN